MHAFSVTLVCLRHVFPIALLFSLFGSVTFAVESKPIFPRGSAFAVSAEDGKRIPIPLEWTEVVLDVKPGLLEAQVTQAFTNRTDTAIEATYLYPLPDGATLTHFELHYRDRIVRSEVREKAAARAIYEGAKTAGKKTALLEQRDPALFSTEVANILPGERVQIVMRFVQPLVLSADTIEVRFPMVTGDKYFPADASPGTEGNAAPNPARRNASTLADIHVYAFDIQIAGIPVQKIESPSHAIRFSRTGSEPERFAVSLEKEITIPDRDFVLRIATRSDTALQPTVVTQRTKTGEYGLVTVFPPLHRPAAAAPVPPRDVLFLIDRSGSMNGLRIENAKLGLEGCLDALALHDRFQIVTFDNVFEFYKNGWTDAGAEAVAEAHRHVRGIQARGGTEVQRALAASLDAFEPSGRQQILILMTDGDVGNGASLLNLVESKIGQVRLFVFGIGSAPNVTLLKQIAQLGRGQARFIANDTDVARELTDLFATLNAPVLSQPRLTLLDSAGNPLEYATFPERLPDVFLGRPIQVVYRAKSMPAAVSLVGLENDRLITRRLALQPAVLRGDGLEKEFGKRLYADTAMMLRRADTPETRAVVRSELLATALQFELVTELTSRVVVDEYIARDPDAPLASQHVAQFRPADQVRVASVVSDGPITLSPFEVNTSHDVGYTAGNTLSGGRTSSGQSRASLNVNIPRRLIEDFALPTAEAILPFAVDMQANHLFARPGSEVALLDGLPIATVVDAATIESMDLQPAGATRNEILQYHPGRAEYTKLTGRLGSDGLMAASMRTAFHPGGDSGASVLALLSWAKFEEAQSSVLLEGEKTFGETRVRLGTQGRELSGYGGMRMLRGSVEQKLRSGGVIEAAFAWHELKRKDASQFRLGSPTARYDGLGFLNLDLLTAETERIADQIVQLKISGGVGVRRNQHWWLRAQWHRHESDEVVDAAGVAVQGVRRDMSELAFHHRIATADAKTRFETQFGLSRHAATQTTDNGQATWQGSFNVDRQLGEGLHGFAAWSREEALPWTTTGRWRESFGGMIMVAPAIETRTGAQLGLKFEAPSQRFTGTLGLFRENVAGHGYRDWNWEQAHPSAVLLGSGELRLPVSTKIAPTFVREGWAGSIGFNPARSFNTMVSWSVDWKNQSPYRGGNQRASAVARYDVRGGTLRGLMVGGALHFRNELKFDDGFTLGGGWRTDVMLGYPLRFRSVRGLLQLNIINLADRSWQLIRFAPERGRQVIFSVSQEF